MGKHFKRTSLIRPVNESGFQDNRFVCIPSLGAAPPDDEAPFLDGYIYSYEMCLTLSAGYFPMNSLWVGAESGSLYRVMPNDEPHLPEIREQLLVGIPQDEECLLLENRLVSGRVRLYKEHFAAELRVATAGGHSSVGRKRKVKVKRKDER